VLTCVQEKTTTYRLYTALNAIATAAALIVGAVIVIISAVRHNKAMTNCKVGFPVRLPGKRRQLPKMITTHILDQLLHRPDWHDTGGPDDARPGGRHSVHGVCMG
jgi:hypothetical protein